jgi:hypothetical protein
MHVRLPAFAAALLALCFASPAGADAPYGQRPALASLDGAYDLNIGNALIRAEGGGQIVPLRAQHTSAITMEAQGDNLMMGDENAVVLLEYADEEDDALNYGELNSVINISVSDIPALFGCSLDRLPALRGAGLAESTEGTPIEFDYELVIYDIRSDGRAEFLGIARWGGGGVVSIRAVTVSPRN